MSDRRLNRSSPTMRRAEIRASLRENLQEGHGDPQASREHPEDKPATHTSPETGQGAAVTSGGDGGLASHKRSRDSYRCPDCEQLFNEKQLLHRHQAESHPSNESIAEAAVAAAAVDPSLNATSPERPHGCKHCKKTFTKLSDLVRHERTHTGERPFVCGFCKAGFSQRYRLTTHIRCHTGEKPFRCSYCDSTFARGDAMRSHTYLMHHQTRTKPK